MWVPLNLEGSRVQHQDELAKTYEVSECGKIRNKVTGKEVALSVHNTAKGLATAQVHLGTKCCPTYKTCIIKSFENAYGDRKQAEQIYANIIKSVA